MNPARNENFAEATRQDIARWRELGWYHSIELPDGTVIPGLQSVDWMRHRLAQFHIPENLSGRRVLDIGAWDGWFSFEMERRGASVVALDSARQPTFLKAREMLGSKVEYRIGDICRLTANELGTFDIVLFFGVLYHVKHPVLALENICGMCTDMACIESFVTDGDTANLNAPPVLEFYETTELRGQTDNWCGPNVSCLMAMTRAAGFARVNFESTIGERAHVSAYRKWNSPPGDQPAPQVLCISNAASNDHNFSRLRDDYATFYFSWAAGELSCDNVYPEIDGFGARPVLVQRVGAREDKGWLAAFKIPPGLSAGWHHARLRVADSAFSTAVRIGLDVTDAERQAVTEPSGLRLTLVTDGRSFEKNRIRTGEGSAISVWVEGLPSDATVGEITIRLNGTDLPASWLESKISESRQVNALLPAGLESGPVQVSVIVGSKASQSARAELTDGK